VLKKTQKRRNRRKSGKPASSNQVEQEAPKRKFPLSRHPLSLQRSPFSPAKFSSKNFPLFFEIKKN